MTELGELRKHYGEILARGVEVVAISVDPPEQAEKLRQKVGLEIRFASDERGVLMDALGIRDENGLPPPALVGDLAAGRDSRDIYMATSYLIDPDGVIRWAYRSPSYRVRAPATEVLAAIDRTVAKAA